MGFQESADLLSEMLIFGFHSQVWVFVNLPFLADPLCEMTTFDFWGGPKVWVFRNRRTS